MKRIWITKTGQQLKIKDMTTEHIKNCIKVLHRYHSAVQSSMCDFGNLLQGEIAQETFDNQLADLYENGWEDKAEEFIYTFEQELEERKKRRE